MNPFDTERRLSQADRDRATIEALKLALGQAAGVIEQHAPRMVTPVGFVDRADVRRFRAMSAPDWEALPVDG